MIFDSEVNKWDMYTSEFDNIIYEKEKLMIIIQDTDKNIFGCYINAKIDKYKYLEKDEWMGERITDENSFIFSIINNKRSDKMIKMDIKKEESKFSFTLYEKECEILFTVGRGHDISIWKQNYKNQCWCEPESFNYPEGKENILVGKIGMKKYFEVKRFVVIQME